MNLKKHKLSKITVEIYSKAGCHLCEIAKETVNRVAKDFLIEILEVDITSDRDLFRKYKEQIPVVFVNGRKLFKFTVDETRFTAALKRLQ